MGTVPGQTNSVRGQLVCPLKNVYSSAIVDITLLQMTHAWTGEEVSMLSIDHVWTSISLLVTDKVSPPVFGDLHMVNNVQYCQYMQFPAYHPGDTKLSEPRQSL